MAQARLGRGSRHWGRWMFSGPPTRGPFLRQLPEVLRPRLPEKWRSFTFRSRSNLAQFCYGDPAIHYEVWFHSRLDLLEVGLHFESDHLTNEHYFSALDERIVEIKGELGLGVELERWDRGWCRVFEAHPLAALDDHFRAAIAARLAAFIVVLEPICDDVRQLALRRR
jgi:hypothetical protein